MVNIYNDLISLNGVIYIYLPNLNKYQNINTNNISRDNIRTKIINTLGFSEGHYNSWNVNGSGAINENGGIFSEFGNLHFEFLKQRYPFEQISVSLDFDTQYNDQNKVRRIIIVPIGKPFVFNVLPNRVFLFESNAFEYDNDTFSLSSLEINNEYIRNLVDDEVEHFGDIGDFEQDIYDSENYDLTTLEDCRQFKNLFLNITNFSSQIIMGRELEDSISNKIRTYMNVNRREADEPVNREIANGKFFDELLVQIEERFKKDNPKGAIRFEALNKTGRKDKTVKEFLNRFFLEFNRTKNTIYVSDKTVQTDTNRRRSIGDIYYLTKYYYPNVTLKEIYDILINVLPKEIKGFRSNHCSQILKYVWYYNEGSANATNNSEAKAEYGCSYNDIKKQL